MHLYASPERQLLVVHLHSRAAGSPAPSERRHDDTVLQLVPADL
jgi:hypothetical protein